MSPTPDQSLLQPEGRVLSTLESDGSRRWLYPRVAPGRFLTRRGIVAYLLIVIFTALPYIHINGKPAILLDVLHRRFTLFGLTFLPTDTVLLALLLVCLLLSIFFVTALFGRGWCGWVCPQTVYMEFVYRPIERLFTGRLGIGGRPRDNVPAWQILMMHAAYLVVSLYLAHTFLAYFVGVDQLRTWMTGSPVQHPIAFAVMVVTTALMVFDFAWFREQTCIIACPYGRFQSVLMDRQSLIISYDRRRGEPRGKQRHKVEEERIKDNQSPASSFNVHPSSDSGDCIDCTMCAQACPMGIDIRDGLQIECIGCAACIDACDAVMDKLRKPRGLIRYSSQAAMEGQPARILRPRVVAYFAIVVVLLGLMVWLIATRSLLDVTILRTAGRPFVIDGSGMVENPMRVKLTNRTDRPMRVSLAVVDRPDVRLNVSQYLLTLGPMQSWTEPLLITAPASAFARGLGTLDVTIRVSGDDGTTIDRSCRLLGPAGTDAAKGAAHARQ
ncbi:cytochrome c oxidase accessory protein CcoG [Fontivita pretiosa]|uniref:cytochrome c oxidase accessory protein CcoG n=1 Tax=Fontivita pretiosa TaxID=2989684 RepID=UPI003D182361